LLHFIPTPIGNLEDISLRSLKLLEQATLLLCEDTRVTKRLIYLLKERALIDPPEQRFISLHSHNEKELLSKLDPELFADQTVLYVSDAGMPAVSDPGCELVRYARSHKIAYEVLPGANAALLAYAASGFCESRFLFYGFLPHKGSSRAEALHEALFNGFVTILYEAPHRILKLIEQICNIDPKRELFLIKEATKLHEKRFFGSAEEILRDLKSQNIKGEWVVVINSDKKETGVISVDDILALDIPKKQAARLIAKITGKSPKACYNDLL
jgi:16S rRNA (cytidine1402-2'-O)-methyltransferase